MDPFTGAMLIGGASTLIGGLLNRDQNREANYQNQVAGDKNAALQKEFAQQGIQWKVEDAKKAGIHPLAALGASTHQFAPSYVGGQADTSMGDTIASMGQNISRGVLASAEKKDRILITAMNEERLKHAKLQNQILESQLSSIQNPVPQSAGLPSPMDPYGGIPGQASTKSVVTKPAEVTASREGVPGMQAGAVSDFGFVRTAEGNLSIVPAKDVKERIEDQILPEAEHALRRLRLVPYGPPPPSPKEFPLPPGYDHWKWNKWQQQFEPAKAEDLFDERAAEQQRFKNYMRNPPKYNQPKNFKPRKPF